jgi:hypothetical protein
MIESHMLKRISVRRPVAVAQLLSGLIVRRPLLGRKADIGQNGRSCNAGG